MPGRTGRDVGRVRARVLGRITGLGVAHNHRALSGVVITARPRGVGIFGGIAHISPVGAPNGSSRLAVVAIFAVVGATEGGDLNAQRDTESA